MAPGRRMSKRQTKKVTAAAKQTVPGRRGPWRSAAEPRVVGVALRATAVERARVRVVEGCASADPLRKVRVRDEGAAERDRVDQSRLEQPLGLLEVIGARADHRAGERSPQLGPELVGVR